MRLVNAEGGFFYIGCRCSSLVDADDLKRDGDSKIAIISVTVLLFSYLYHVI